MDLTTRLNNWALSCDNHAKDALQRAELLRATAKTSFPEYNAVHIDRPLKEATDEAANWQRRAAEARRGYLLMDPADITFQMENQDFVNEAAAQYRITYAGALANPTQPLHPADDPSWQRNPIS